MYVSFIVCSTKIWYSRSNYLNAYLKADLAVSQ